jgi:signal transduction histidine kinase
MDSTDPDVPFRRLAWPLCAVGLLTAVGTAALAFANRSAMHSLDQANPTEIILPVGYAIIGALLASRKPRNPIGWIFLGIAIFTGIPGLASQYVFRNWHFHRLPAAGWVAWTHDPLGWLVFPPGLATFFFLLFPDGHLRSHRWRWVARTAVVLVVVGFVFLVLQRSIVLNGSPAMANPIGSAATVNMQTGLPGLIWLVGLAVLLTSMVGTVLRTRGSTGELRQQLRWLSFAAALTAIGLISLMVSFAAGLNPPNGAFDLIIVLGFGVAIPLSCGIAILKHGLYDLDVVISKALVYALLAAFFTGVYLAVVIGVGTVIGSRRNQALTVFAAATIAVAFNPVRERAKRFANRLVYGKRASPYEVLSEFSERMAGTYSVEDVLPRMAILLGEGTGAREASVWLRVGDELRPSATWGSTDAPLTPIPISDGRLPEIAGASKVMAVRHLDELLGALAVTKPPNEPLTTAEDKLVNDLAAQAGLVLRNVRLTEELRANLEELRASRQRLVTAQDGERRRIERNIHDGAQQQLVALAVQTRLAENLTATDPEKGREILRRVQQGLQDALDDLRDLARGIYPPLLADQGLVAALSAQAGKSAITVTVEADHIERLPQDAEAAVYFCALEALQNVAKYAGATGATVRLRRADGDLLFEVADDGQGFDPASTGYGTGVQGMVDRLAALGGTLTIESAPGAGTTVIGRLPVGEGAST